MGKDFNKKQPIFRKPNNFIWNLFLQVFDDGRLTDKQGRTVDFSHPVIIMTSNLGANLILDAIENKTDVKPELNSLLKKLHEYQL